MEDKKNLSLNDEQLENVVGGFTVSELLSCSDEKQAMRLLMEAGIKPGTDRFVQIMTEWKRMTGTN